MKKLLSLLLCLVAIVFVTSCGEEETIVVYTESGFPPFEYVSNGEIKGVDVDIMNKVGEKLGKKIIFENVSFDTIIDAVSAGKLADVGAAGISVTPARIEKVDFSQVYYQANLYVIYDVNKNIESKTMTDGNTGVYWSKLQTNLGIGVQTGTTADLFLTDEVGEGGSLEGVEKTNYASLDVALSDIGLSIDYVIIDELPAKQLCKNNANLACLPLYYSGDEGDELAFDEYAICVTKGNDELLSAINEVLSELLKKDENGVNEIQKMVNHHLGL